MTPATLRLIMPFAGAQADTFAGPLTEAMTRWGITTPARQAAFLANVAVETQQLRVVVEDLDYTAERLAVVWPLHFRSVADAQPYAHRPELLANLVYAGRDGNGAATSGDGWHFRGRALPMLTGRANYEACGKALELPLLVSPELLERPENAAQAGGWFWASKGLNELADRDPNSFGTTCHRWNGGFIGLDARIGAWIGARAWLGVKP